MANEKELKPKSFRIDEDTAEKFKQISNEIGGNQQETLSKLIESFEFQKGKAILTEKKDDIETFEKYVTALTRMYMSSLEDNQNITDTVRTEFDALLKSKDFTIQELQQQITVAKELKEDATIKVKSFSEDNVRLNNLIEKTNKDYNEKVFNLESMLYDKDNLNKALTDSCNELKHKVDTMQVEHQELQDKTKELQSIEKKLDKSISDYNELLKTKEDLEKQLQLQINHYTNTIEDMKQHEIDSLQRAEQQAQLNIEKALLDLEKKYQQQIQKIKEDKQNEIDKYQQKYFELLEQLNSKDTEIK